MSNEKNALTCRKKTVSRVARLPLTFRGRLPLRRRKRTRPPATSPALTCLPRAPTQPPRTASPPSTTTPASRSVLMLRETSSPAARSPSSKCPE
jgi:hypothetical protein